MADKDKDTFRGFQALADNLIKPGAGGPPAIDDDDDIPFVEPDDIKKDLQDDDLDKDKDQDIDDDLDDNKDDDLDKDDDQDSDKSGKDDTSDTDDQVDPDFEKEVTKFFQQKFAEEIGLDFNEEETFDSVADLVKNMETIVANASKPIYANEEVGKIDEFVKNGGKIEDYYKAITTGSIDVDTIDITKESSQRLVIEEHLRTLGYEEDRVQKVVDRYEDRGVLEEEAEDALELLKKYKEKNKEKLLENQKNNAAAFEKEQQKFISNVEETIKDLTDVAGYKLSAREKQELSDYIFKPTKDGRTAYQIEYSADQARNLIESAFFTKNKDVILEKAKKQASTNTLKDMQQKLKAKGKRTKNVDDQDISKGSVQLSLLGRQLIKQ